MYKARTCYTELKTTVHFGLCTLVWCFSYTHPQTKMNLLEIDHQEVNVPIHQKTIMPLLQAASAWLMQSMGGNMYTETSSKVLWKNHIPSKLSISSAGLHNSGSSIDDICRIPESVNLNGSYIWIVIGG